jgi:hypothetical protein
MRTPDYFDGPQLTDRAPRLYGCDRHGCGRREQTAGEFFECVSCSETLCPSHAPLDLEQTRCDACEDRARDDVYARAFAAHHEGHGR